MTLVCRLLTGEIPLAIRQPAGSVLTSSELTSLKQEVAAIRSYCSDQIKIVQQSVAGQGPVRIGNYVFDSAKSCGAQLQAWRVTTSVFDHFQDPVHLLAPILQRSKSHEDVTTNAILSLKTSHSPARLTTISSYKTQVPKLFGGTKVSRTDMSPMSNFASIKTPNLWDAGDGETGIKNYIEQSLLDFLPQDALFGGTILISCPSSTSCDRRRPLQSRRCSMNAPSFTRICLCVLAGLVLPTLQPRRPTRGIKSLFFCTCTTMNCRRFRLCHATSTLTRTLLLPTPWQCGQQ